MDFYPINKIRFIELLKVKANMNSSINKNFIKDYDNQYFLHPWEDCSNNNSDYKAKRFKSITLDRPRLIKARKNLFYDWLKKKKKLGGQNKVPRLLNERSFIEELIEMN